MATSSSKREEDPPLEPSPASHAGADQLQAWHRLRSLIASASEELRSIREENARLRERIAELEAGSTLPSKGLDLQLEDDPAQLRRRIDSFIETLDSYLQRNR